MSKNYYTSSSLKLRSPDSSSGLKINADANGAANILRKVAVKLGFNLSRISSGDLIAPLKIRLWTLQESPGL
jgi:transposase